MDDQRASIALAKMAGIDPAPTGKYDLGRIRWWQIGSKLKLALQYKLDLDERIARATEAMAENGAEMLRRSRWEAPEEFTAPVPIVTTNGGRNHG